MNILQILPELNVGGVETGTVDLAQYLVQHGHRSVVISQGGRLVSGLEAAGSKHYQFPVHKKSLWTIFRMIQRVRKIILNEDIQIVHARSRVPAWIAYFASRGTNAVFVTTCHGYYRNRFLSQVMGWGKLVIVPSASIGRHMIEDFDIQPDNIRKIARSVNLAKFQKINRPQQNKTGRTIAMVGRITPLKGHTYFLQAMAKVVRQMPYVKIWIIGDAPASKQAYKQELLELVKRLGLVNQVEFLGNRADVPQLLTQVDVLVLATVTQESFGRVILEAQAVGVPVVATRVGGVVDIIEDEQTGLLVTPKDCDAMAKAVIRILNEPALAQSFTAQAQKKLLEQFTLEKMALQTLAVYEELLKKTKILVIKMSSLGDVILITPSLKALRKKFPEAQIYCLVGKASRQVLNNCPYLDELIVYDPQFKDKGWLNLFRLGLKLRTYRLDKIVDFQNNRRSHLLAFLSSPRESYGYKNGKWSFFLTHPVVEVFKNISAVPHQFQILKHLGISYRENKTSLELWPSEKDKRYIQRLLDEEWLGNVQNIIGIHIAASEKWKTKNWPLEYIARLCDILAGKGVRVVLTGTEKEKPLAQELLAKTKSKPSDLAGKTDVMQLAALIGRCKVFVTPDSAPMHIAAAMHTPFIAFFGPTDSARHIPPAQKFVVLERKLTCAPCYSSRCRILTHACMREIKPEEVSREIERLSADVPV